MLRSYDIHEILGKKYEIFGSEGAAMRGGWRLHVSL